MWRYMQAFVKALSLTLRGETYRPPAARQYPRLFSWLEASQGQMQQLHEAAEQYNLGDSAYTVRIDGRDTPLAAVLGGVRYHLQEEYPYMLRHLTEHTLTGIYASNLNDQYWLEKAATHPDLSPTLKAALLDLHKQLKAIPPSNNLGK